MSIDWIFWLFMNFKLDFVHTIDIILFLLGIRWSLFRFLQRHSFSFYFLWPNQGHTKRATRVTNWICIPFWLCEFVLQCVRESLRVSSGIISLRADISSVEFWRRELDATRMTVLDDEIFMTGDFAGIFRLRLRRELNNRLCCLKQFLN